MNPKIAPPWANRNRDEVKAILKEFSRRQMEALRLYEPLPFQDRYHRCTLKECILMKGTRVGGEQPLASKVFTPNGYTTIGEISVGDEVLGGDGLPCRVRGVVEYGESPVYRFLFSDGTSCESGENHKWVCRAGGRARRPRHATVGENGWNVITTRDIVKYVEKHGCNFGGGRGRGHYRICFPRTVAKFSEKPVPVDPYLLGVLLGDGNFTHGHVSITSADREIIQGVSLPEKCRVNLIDNKSTRQEGHYGKASLYSITGTEWRNNPVLDALRDVGLFGVRGDKKFIPRLYLENGVSVRLGILQGLMDTDGRCGKRGDSCLYTTSHKMVDGVIELVRSLGGTAGVSWSESSHKGKRGLPIASVSITLPEGMNPHRLARKSERRNNLKRKYRGFKYLKEVTYVGVKPCRCINVDNASRTYLTDDYIVTHNSLAGFVEDARAALACDPYDKYPKKDGNIICLGYGEPHVGRVIHRLLFRPGAFTIIQDEKSKEWRVYRPWPRDEQRNGHSGDQGREKESMPSPPLIPAYRIKGRIAWVKKNHYIFHRVDLDTGWAIYAANSAGDPKQVQGFDVHLYHIDEDLATNGWYLEASSRTQMVEGKLRWTALPHGENDDLLNLVRRADEQQDNPDKISVVLRATMYDNPYMSDKTKRELEILWKSAGDDVFRQRALGELSTESTKMYPTFNTRIHSYKLQTSAACRTLQERNGQVPEGWTRYMIVDPGHTICGVFFIAVPPIHLGDHAYAYDECYVHQATAAMFGEVVEPKANAAPFQAFIIDAHGGALRELGSGLTPREQYSSQLARRGITSVETKTEFLSGCDHMEGRETALREWLRIREDGTTKLIVNVEQCPNFCREMESFKKKYVVNNGQRIVLNEGNRRASTHLVECSEYAAAHGCKYVKPPKSIMNRSWVDRMLDAEKAQRARFRVINGVGSDRTINLGPQGVGS